jgi:hypothetical protein
VKTTVARFGMLLALLDVSGCERPEVDQIAQHSLIGMSKTKILACLGQPAKRVRVGFEDIWTFPIGEMRTEGGPFALGLNAYSAPSSLSRLCNVKIVIGNYGVSQVAYSGPDDAALPLGQMCIFPVRNCIDP